MLAGVTDFLYQLQDYDLNAMGNSAYDLVIMDYSADGDDETAFSKTQIEDLKHSPGGEKIVLAYVSIGEAENYRYYWQSQWRTGNPSWLDKPNPDWKNNYKVRYWNAEWQAVVFTYLDRLLAAGFDGVYLDIIDAYEYHAERGRDTAPQDMADFVAAIAGYARSQDPDFLVVPQNSPELADMISSYLRVVDGIGQEDIYFGYEDDDQRTPRDATQELETYLDLFRDAGKIVLTTDYATTRSKVDEAYAKSRAKGYVPFVTVRDLDILTVNFGQKPD